jgi:L-ascorbate metabolism protein UlaG (beta-lactamase superfamily)
MSLLLFFIFLLVSVFLFTQIHPVFGGKPSMESLEKIKKSPYFEGKKFTNITPVSVITKKNIKKEGKYPHFSMLFPSKEKNPSQPLPSYPFEKENITNNSFTWLGHSSILMNIQHTNIIIDPVFHRASPIGIFGSPFSIQHPFSQKDLPKIDIVLISHDHYDHLDYKSIQAFDNSISTYIVPLGVKAHLEKWGIESNRIQEIDWYETHTQDNIDFILTPSQHFSGRGLTNRYSTLWGGFIIQSLEQKIYISGDGGYSDEFKKIGKKFGPFDIAFIESGAYNTQWANMHMFPEESVQAGKDVQAKVIMPVHWAKFDLAPHQWKEPIERFVSAAKKEEIQITTPFIGETFFLKNIPQHKWWEEI